MSNATQERPETKQADHPTERPPKRISIVGFTSSRKEAPWGQDGWDIWICNNLWRFCPPQWHRLYDLHATKEIKTDQEHESFLRGQAMQHAETGEQVQLGNRPVYVFEPQPEWPNAVRFPQDEITGALGTYFSNSISWMVAHALMEMSAEATKYAKERVAEEKSVSRAAREALNHGARLEYLSKCELHVYGVDLATGGEYSAQRPSCEHFLGIAAGMGVQVYIPPQSDLLKVTAMYGTGGDDPLYAKMTERKNELTQRAQALQQQQAQINDQLNQIKGALETTSYIIEVWTNPRAERDGSPKGQEPQQSEPSPNGSGDKELVSV